MQPSRVRVRLAIAGLALAVALGIETHPTAAAQSPPATKGPTVIYQKSRSFRVPFQIKPEEGARRRELQLWGSDDKGRHWKQQAVTTPDRPAFTFNAEHDGEYWLAVRSMDAQGRLIPADDARIEPSMKIVVDTTSPSIVLEPLVRSASLASVRWEVRDDYPDIHPPVLEYQVEGQKVWRPVPIDAHEAPGVVTWDSGVAQPLHIRATALDIAGNKSEKILILGSSKPGQSVATAPASLPQQTPALTASSELQRASAPQRDRAQDAVSPVDPISMTGLPGGLPPRQSSAPAERQALPVPADAKGHPDTRNLPAEPQRAVAPILASAQDIAHLSSVPVPAAMPAPVALEPPADGAASSVPSVDGAPFATQIASAPLSPESLVSPPVGVGDKGTREAPAPGHGAGLEPPVPPLPTSKTQFALELGPDPGVGMAALTHQGDALTPTAASAPPVTNTLKVPGPQFLLDYAVDRAGPDGRPAVVEIWVTEDGGKTWSKQGKDPDRVSPIQVDLKTAGRFGISLIARDADGLGDKPPAPGDVPKMWIEVEPQTPAQSQTPRPSRSSSLLQRALRR